MTIFRSIEFANKKQRLTTSYQLFFASGTMIAQKDGTVVHLGFGMWRSFAECSQSCQSLLKPCLLLCATLNDTKCIGKTIRFNEWFNIIHIKYHIHLQCTLKVCQGAAANDWSLSHLGPKRQRLRTSKTSSNDSSCPVWICALGWASRANHQDKSAPIVVHR